MYIKFSIWQLDYANFVINLEINKLEIYLFSCDVCVMCQGCALTLIQ